MKNIMSDKSIELISNAIVEQAAEDYATAYMGGRIENKPPSRTIKEVESFFHSDWYKQLTNVDADWLILHVKIRELEKVIEIYEQVLSIRYNPFFKISVIKPKGEENINFTIPPRLTENYLALVRKQLDQLKKELEDLRKEDKRFSEVEERWK